MTESLARKRPPRQESAPSKQKMMLMQFATQQRRENPNHHLRTSNNQTANKAKTKPAWRFVSTRDHCLRIYLTTILTLVIGGACYAVYSTEIFSTNSEAVRPRYLITVFPEAVKSQLPYFVDKYSIASENNQQARQLLQQLTQKRSMLATNSFHLFAWEVAEFQEKLNSTDRMDAACGVKGYGDVYDKHEHLRKDLMQWCLLLGRPDGYLDWDIVLETGWTRPAKGVIGQYLQEDGANGHESRQRMSTSLVMLPIDDSGYSGFRVSLSKSGLPTHVLEWIIIEGPKLSPNDYQKSLENLIYQKIDDGKEHWILWQVACTEAQRRHLDELSTRMATTCTEHVADPNCCSFYDPST